MSDSRGDSLDRFFEHYYRRRPVNATFTGVHEYDAILPDWSRTGLAALGEEMRTLGDALAREYPRPPHPRAYADDARLLDAELARGFLAIQQAEIDGRHGPRGNPVLWTGEAIFAVVSLMIRDFAPLAARIDAATARLNAIPSFLADASLVLSAHGDGLPGPWCARALRECEGARILFTRGIARWIDDGNNSLTGAAALRAAAAGAVAAFAAFAQWLRGERAALDGAIACGPEMYDLLLAEGHQSTQSRAQLLEAASTQLAGAQEHLRDATARAGAPWPSIQAQLAADHPAPADYLACFTRTWNDCHQFAAGSDVVPTWPDWPIRYVPMPAWTSDAAPFLYYLFYRSPAPFDAYGTHDYVVPPLPPDRAEEHLRAWNRSVIKLNHVIHHGGVGHHVQNWHAYTRAASRVGRIAAVDCANRIGVFCGGTMAEGWACYATDLMNQLGFLTSAEQASEAHSRVRFLARAIMDIHLHQGSMSFDAAVHFFSETTGATVDVARNEVTKASLFPGTALMYWLGVQSIEGLRDAVMRRSNPPATLRAFHDELLGYGSIPVPLIARMMTEGAS